MDDSRQYAVSSAALRTLRHEILGETARICQSGLLTPQERTLLQRIVEATIDGQNSQLYQKAIADELDMPNPKQVGVVATRLRAKLIQYRDSRSGGLLNITLSDRGYEAWISYRQTSHPLNERAQIAVANAKAALDQRTLPGIAAALKHLQQALAAEPDHPVLLATKAHCHATRALFGTYPRGDLEQAESILAGTAHGQRPWESLFAEGCVRMALHWDWTGAGRAFEHAIALSGGAASHLPWYTAFLANQGRAAESVPLLRAALSKAHDSPIVRADLAANQIFAGQYGEAQETIDTAFALFGPRTHYLLYVHQALLHEATGNAAAAVDVINRVPLKFPQTSVTLGLRALFSGLAGDRRTARRHFLKLRGARMLAGRYVPAGQVGIAAIGAGDIDAGIGWLSDGADVERDPNMVLINVYPFFRHLYTNPRFTALVTGTMKLALPSA